MEADVFQKLLSSLQAPAQLFQYLEGDLGVPPHQSPQAISGNHAHSTLFQCLAEIGHGRMTEQREFTQKVPWAQYTQNLFLTRVAEAVHFDTPGMGYEQTVGVMAHGIDVVTPLERDSLGNAGHFIHFLMG